MAKLQETYPLEKKAIIVKRAAELNVRLTNTKGKLKSEEKKPENA